MTDTIRELKVAYDNARNRAKAQAKAEFNARVDEISAPERMALSQALHEAHASGITKAELNALIGVHNNKVLSGPIWSEYQPINPTDLRRKAVTIDEPMQTLTITGGQVTLSLSTGDVTVTGITTGTEDGVTWIEFDNPEQYTPDEYAEIVALITRSTTKEEA